MVEADTSFLGEALNTEPNKKWVNHQFSPAVTDSAFGVIDKFLLNLHVVKINSTVFLYSFIILFV